MYACGVGVYTYGVDVCMCVVLMCVCVWCWCVYIHPVCGVDGCMRVALVRVYAYGVDVCMRVVVIRHSRRRNVCVWCVNVRGNDVDTMYVHLSNTPSHENSKI